ESGIIHFLTEGDVLTTDGKIILASWKHPCSSNDPPTESLNIFNDFRKVSLQVAKYSKNIEYRGYVGRNPVVEVKMQKTAVSQTVCGVFNGTAYTSFTHMNV